MRGANEIVSATRTITLGVFASLLLSACGSSPPVRYYSLTAVDSNFQQDPDDALLLGLGPLRMPDYLNRSQIVTRGDGAELIVDDFSRWAEPLTLSLHRVVSTEVDNLMNDVAVIAFPYEMVIRDQVDFRMLGDVNRFDADRSGLVVLEVQWVISKTGTGLAETPKRTRYEVQAATADNPGAMAEAMNEALAMFGRDIATQLEALLSD